MIFFFQSIHKHELWDLDFLFFFNGLAFLILKLYHCVSQCLKPLKSASSYLFIFFLIFFPNLESSWTFNGPKVNIVGCFRWSLARRHFSTSFFLHDRAFCPSLFFFFFGLFHVSGTWASCLHRKLTILPFAFSFLFDLF